MSSYRLIATTDNCRNCDCCGRSIKRAAVLTESESVFPGPEEVVRFGLQCAATTLQRQGAKGFKILKSNKEMILAAEKAAYELSQRQKDALLLQGKVKFLKGCWLLPENPQQMLDGKIDLDAAIALRNELYPCFAV